MSVSSNLLTLSLALVGLGLMTASSEAQRVEIEAEFGAVYSTHNDVKVPGDTGTLLSLTDDLSTPTRAAGRVRVGLRHNRHLLSLMYAPLQLESSGTLERDIHFAGVDFLAGEEIDATFKFDSYRATYRFSLVHQFGIELAVGATAMFRDSEIRLQGAELAEHSERGFVPLANLHMEWRSGAYGVLVNADAMALQQWRAEDVLVAASVKLLNGFRLYAGYRAMEGGTDNEDIYSSAWLHYAVAGLSLHL